MKKIINKPEDVVKEMIQGMVLAHPKYIKNIEQFNIITRKNKKDNKVALISGGGSGHEPSHGGFVGEGMLDAAVCGAVFTSPTPDQVYEAIKEVQTKEGVLLIIKNYTGDVMNFEMAMEMAMADDIKVDKVIIDDDVAVMNSTYTIGRRGIAGTVLLHKITGAAAEKGLPLDEVKRIALKVIENVGSMGVALSPCIVPEARKPNFILLDNEMEIGMGIHGEPGIEKTELKTADQIAEVLVEKIVVEKNLSKDDETIVMVNGLGATPLMELYVVNKKVNELLTDKGIKVYDTVVGNYMTSIEMAGLSVSVLKVDDEIKALFDAKADTPAFKSV